MGYKGGVDPQDGFKDPFWDGNGSTCRSDLSASGAFMPKQTSIIEHFYLTRKSKLEKS